MRGLLPDREDEITVRVRTSNKKGRVGEFDPAGELSDKTYKLRFSMKALLRAERHFSRVEALVEGQPIAPVGILRPGTVKAILDRVLDDTLENFLMLLYWTLLGDQPAMTEAEMMAIAEADFDLVQAAVYGVVGRSMPEPKKEADDPKAPTTSTPGSPEPPSTIS